MCIRSARKFPEAYVYIGYCGFLLVFINIFEKMYKRGDLARLKKDDIVRIAVSLNIETDKKIKCGLIDEICVKQTLSVGVGDGSANQSGQIVDFVDSTNHYQQLSDDTLHSIPRITFMEIYHYFRENECESTFKALDRAVKHTSAGDVSCVAFCQVSHFPHATNEFDNDNVCVLLVL